MIDGVFQHGVKAALVTAGTLWSWSVATAGIGDEQLFGMSVNTIRELGSFGLIAVFVLGVLWLCWKAIPVLIAMLERTKDQFVAEIKEERIARERSVEAFRDMLKSHKSDLGDKMDSIKDSIDEGNDIVSSLVTELSQRPCQRADAGRKGDAC